jgi:hypothetical protein
MFEIPEVVKNIGAIICGVYFLVLVVVELATGRVWVKESGGHFWATTKDYWWWVAIQLVGGVFLIFWGLKGFRERAPEK